MIVLVTAIVSFVLKVNILRRSRHEIDFADDEPQSEVKNVTEKLENYILQKILSLESKSEFDFYDLLSIMYVTFKND